MNNLQQELNFSIVDTQMTVDAMRNSGYKSTTHALAELIDNSLEAGASEIEIIGVSRRDDNTGRITLQELAVLDDGAGMNSDHLRGSLRYGHGTRRAERAGIGRFGLGLPNSSMSQARRVDIWSWRRGVTNAVHTRLWLDDVERGQSEIPAPDKKRIPDVYKDASKCGFKDTGTLVIWSDLDRVEWKQAATTFRHAEALLGRIYRRFLAKPQERLHTSDSRNEEIGNQRRIRCISVFEDDDRISLEKDGIVDVRPNDPLYLMSGTSCPEDFGTGPMFIELEASPFSVPISYKGLIHTVQVRAAYAAPYARDSQDPKAQWPEKLKGLDAGRTPWGKHAEHNRGVSLMRAHREIQLDESWTSGDDPRERWWTVEVDFPTSLDEIFGVTNNKQSTTTFQRLARFDHRREKLPNEETVGDVRRRMEEEGDPRAGLLNLRTQIENTIKPMRDRVRQSRRRRRTNHDSDADQKADAKATAVIKKRAHEGHKGQSDQAGEQGSPQEHQQAQVESLVEKHHMHQRDALRKIEETIKVGSRVRWLGSRQSSPAFFDVEPLPNVIQVALNMNHPVYEYLYEIMRSDADSLESLEEDEIRERLEKVEAAFRILLYSWARYEEEQNQGSLRQVRNTRIEWGKYAEEFFGEDDDEIPPANSV